MAQEPPTGPASLALLGPLSGANNLYALRAIGRKTVEWPGAAGFQACGKNGRMGRRESRRLGSLLSGLARRGRCLGLRGCIFFCIFVAVLGTCRRRIGLCRGRFCVTVDDKKLYIKTIRNFYESN
ncbi:MAG: hypothetical protein J1E84_03075 [Muribaculaceae bacterium]|nr:hypothetical protein [Muribaculaceae bacterium]